MHIVFKYLKAKNHKGISKLKLLDLGYINVICGKNNSGKTAILEALNTPDKFGIGKKIDSQEWLEKLFEPEAKRYSEPNPSWSKEWFSNHISKIIKANTIWFHDEKDQIIEDMLESQKKDVRLKRHEENLFNLNKIVDSIFENQISKYKTILIPPKRFLDYKVPIQLSQQIDPVGRGITNRLFFLKNQDLHSSDYNIYKKIYSAFNEITDNFFNIFPDKNNYITLYFKKSDGDWIKADSCGLGLSDVLIIITFALDTDCTFIFIEEPESHLHPEMQKRLINFIKNIKSKQFIFSTHSNFFLDPYEVDKIFYTNFEDKIRISDETSKSKILHNLGYSVADNLVADMVVLTEGPTDVPVLKTIFNWMGFGKACNIRFWPLGGDIMASLDLSVLAERNNVVAIIDSDPNSKVIRTRFQRNCEKYGIRCYKLERYSIENYFTVEALRKVFSKQIPKKITIINPEKKVDEQIEFLPKGKSIKTKNNEIIQKMSLNDLMQTDLYSICSDIQKAIGE